MDLQPIHNYVIRDTEILPVSAFIPFEKAGSVYEVVRIILGIPLFLEDHLTRFFESARLAKKEIRLTKNQIFTLLEELIAKSQVFEGNIFIGCNEVFAVFYIEHKYPEEKLYSEGVVCGVLEAERNLPNAKIIQTPVRKQADALIKQYGFFEVLLVDHLKRITEGSRSNVFFIRGNSLITPPGNEVLLGITRKKAILLAKAAGFEVYEKDIYLDEIDSFESSFITGTSPKLLPIRKIGNVNFQTQNEKLRMLIDSYNHLIVDYISNMQNK